MTPLANAPVTWGVWGPHSLPPHRTPDDILRTLAVSGYTGVELGSPTFFGRGGAEIAEALARHGLACAGIYVPLRPLHGRDALSRDLDALRAVCATLGALPDPGPVMLAGESVEAIQRHVRRGRRHPELDLTATGWRALLDGMAEGGRIVRDHGLTASFHPHTGTHVEQPHEVDRFLDGCDLGLTLDTGHAAAGGDSVADLLRRWGPRLDHVHLKDVRLAPVERAAAEGTLFSIADVSVPLGEGDLDLAGVLRDLRDMGYAGWIVVEQDRRPTGGHDHAAVDEEQRRNLEWVRACVTP